MTVIQYKIRQFATIQSDFGHIWEQEAASSSLATPILQTHVDSVRIGVRFCFVVEIAGRISENVQNLRTLQDSFPKTEQFFFYFLPFCGIDKSPQVRYTE